jgi:hypothetical protein
LDAPITHKKALELARQKRYYEKNKEKIKARRKEKAYHLTDRARAYNRQYLEAHREQSKAYQHKHYEVHREAVIQRTRAWVAANPDKVRAQRRRYWGYEINETDWQSLFRRQGKRCAICQTKEPGARGWHTDHDHSTKKIRGILCQQCNHGLGNFKDTTALLEAAVEYLRTSATL